MKKIAALVDISGSIHPREVKKYESIIERWARSFKVVVIFHDHKVLKVADYAPGVFDALPQGGGSDVGPALTQACDLGACAALSFTDGIFCLGKRPSIPVLWHSTDELGCPPRWWGFNIHPRLWKVIAGSQTVIFVSRLLWPVTAAIRALRFPYRYEVSG